MKTGREDKESKGLGDRYQDIQPSPGPVPGPDGMPTMPTGFLGSPDPIPAATPENFLCLRGPCRFYLEFHSMADVEVRGLDHAPKQINRYCTVIQGDSVELTDECITACNAWDPMQPVELRAREERRNIFRQSMATRKKEIR